MDKNSHLALRLYDHRARSEILSQWPIVNSVFCMKIHNGNQSMIGAWFYIAPSKNNTSYCCFGASLDSTDGEFREMLIVLDSERIRESSDLAELADKLFVFATESGLIQIEISQYSPEVTQFAKDFMHDPLFVRYIFFRLWFNIYHKAQLEAVDEQLDENAIILLCSDEYAPFYRVAKNIIGDNVNAFFFRLDKIDSCQKMMPIYLHDVLNYKDISYTFWREVYFSKRMTATIYSKSTYAFPFTSFWAIVENGADINAYDNKYMHKRINNSRIYDEIEQGLRKLDDLTLLDVIGSDLEWRDANFKNISRGIDDIIMKAERNIKLTNLSGIIAPEKVGRTLSDVLKTSNHIYYEKAVIQQNGFYSSVLFDMVYHLLVLHREYQISHGDLHLNNVTILFERKFHSSRIYNIDGREYNFPFCSHGAYIIDFSKSLIWDTAEIMINTKMSPDAFYSEQANRMRASTDKTLAAIYSKYDKKLRERLLMNAENYVRIMANYDCYLFFGSFSDYLKRFPDMFVTEVSTDESKILMSSYEQKLIIDVGEFAKKTFIEELISFITTGKMPESLLVERIYSKFMIDFAPVAYEKTLPRNYNDYLTAKRHDLDDAEMKKLRDDSLHYIIDPLKLEPAKYKRIFELLTDDTDNSDQMALHFAKKFMDMPYKSKFH